MENRLKRIMAQVLDVPEDTINDSASAHTIPTWDSLKHIDLILSLQKEFGIVFEDDEIPTMTNFNMILITIQSYLE